MVKGRRAALGLDIALRVFRMAGTGSEKRTEERVDAALPVRLDHASGITRNVSASGLYFETQAAVSAGGQISFTVDLEVAGAAMVLSCLGEIVRVHQRGDYQGVAVRILDSTLRTQSRPKAHAAQA
jgi:hypothetical protein